MMTLRAREVLQALVQGVDPATGVDLPSESVLHRAEVLRAFLAGIAALEDSAARGKRRAQLPGNAGRAWEAVEEEALLTAFKAGTGVEELAKIHGRTIRGIEARLEWLGVLQSRWPLTFPDARGDSAG